MVVILKEELESGRAKAWLWIPYHYLFTRKKERKRMF